jgi:hypothetical protein
MVTLLVPYGVIKTNQLTEPMKVPIPKKIGKILNVNHKWKVIPEGDGTCLLNNVIGEKPIVDRYHCFPQTKKIIIFVL